MDMAKATLPARRVAPLTLALVRVIYRGYRVMTGAVGWLRRRLTLAGWVIAGSLVLSLGIGVDVNQAVAYQLSCLLVVVLLLSAASAFGFRGRFQAIRMMPRCATVGSPVTISARVRNGSNSPQAGLDWIEEIENHTMDFESFLAELVPTEKNRTFGLSKRPQRPPLVSGLQPATLSSIEPGGETEAFTTFTPGRRGSLRFGPGWVGCRDVLGVFRALRRIPIEPSSLVILPKRYVLPRWALPGARQYQPGGVAQASSIGESDEFVALRDYRPGDPLNRIHWKSWARAGKPVVKVHQDEFFVRYALVLDTFASADDAEVFEEAVSIAASFAVTLDTQESLLDLLFIGLSAFCVTAGRGLAQADQLLEVLAGVPPCRSHGFEELKRVVLDHAPRVSGCICVLLGWDESRRELIRQLEALSLPVQVLVVVPRDAKTKPSADGVVRDPARFTVLECGRIQKDLAG